MSKKIPSGKTNNINMEEWMQLPSESVEIDVSTSWTKAATSAKTGIWHTIEQGTSNRPMKQGRRSTWSWVAVIAAVGLLFIGISQYFYAEGRDAEPIVWMEKSAPLGGRTSINLPDGSLVHLNSGTKISYPSRFTKNVREVKLEGEAYFEVIKDTDRPFIVNTEKVNVRVLGTKFNITCYADEDQVETVLLEGSVSFGANKTKERVILTPGQLVSYDKSSGEYQLRKVDPAGFVSWKEGRLTFKSTPLDLITKRLGRFFNVKVVLKDESLKELRFTGVFYEDESLEQLLFLLNNDGQIQYEFRPGKIEIARNTIQP